MKYDLFIDSDLEDKPVADMVYSALEAGGLNCYYPRWFRLRSRGGYGQFVRDELDDSRMLIVIFSESAARPDPYGNIFLDHVDLALHRGNHVIAVVLDDAPVPMKLPDDHPLLHWVDVSRDAVERELGHMAELARELMGGRVRSMEEEAFEMLVESAAPLTDTSLIEAVIVYYKPLVEAVAGSFKNYYDVPDLEERINDGTVGLLKAIRDYESDQGVSFRAYAEKRIHREIMIGIRLFLRRGSGA